VYDWDELDHLLPPSKRVALSEILRAIEHRMGGLRALTELEMRVVADSSSGWNEALANELRRQVHARWTRA
jgi:hypothetical protein